MAETPRRLPDASDFYDAERALHEYVEWLLAGHYKKNLEAILPRIAELEKTQR